MHVAFYDSVGVVLRLVRFLHSGGIFELLGRTETKKKKYRINSLLDLVYVLFCAFLAVADCRRLPDIPNKDSRRLIRQATLRLSMLTDFDCWNKNHGIINNRIIL